MGLIGYQKQKQVPKTEKKKLTFYGGWLFPLYFFHIALYARKE